MISPWIMVIGKMISHGERSKLERIAIRLFAVVERCEDPTVQHKLRELAEELAKVIEQGCSDQLTEFN